MVKQVKEAFAEMNVDWKKGEDEMKQKMDSIIELQCMRLDLERQRLEFEREKYGLQSTFTQGSPAITSFSMFLFVFPPPQALLLPIIAAAGLPCKMS